MSTPDDFARSEHRRRTALKLGLGAAVATLAGWQATAANLPSTTVTVADPLPEVDARFPSQIAQGVWLLPDHRINLVPNIGIVVGRDAALIIDCGLNPDSGARVLDAARKLAPGRKLILTTTHAHPEHAFGAAPFKGQAEYILNSAQNDYLVKTGPAIREMFKSFGPDITRMLASAEIVPATRTYDGDSATIDLGGRTVQLRNWGTAHSPGDQTVYLPEERVLFSGDMIEDRMFPIVPLFPPQIPASAINTQRWTEALLDMERLNPAIIVPGHGNLGGVELARIIIDYFQDVQARVADGLKLKGAERTIAELPPALLASYPTWEHQQFAELAVRYFVQA